MRTALVLVVISMAPLGADATSSYSSNVVPSWGDSLVAYGPGTDPAMDTPEALQHMIVHWKGRGYTGLYLRTDLEQLGPELVRLNPIQQPNPRLAWMWQHTDKVAASFDLHGLAQKLCDRHGLDFWAWHPHVYSDGAPEDVGTPGVGRMIPWRYVSTYTAQHPEVITVDRRGNPLWMVREYAYPGARASKVAEFVHMARTQGIRGFLVCMRSEVSQLVDPPDKADRYGFNEPVVRDMKRLYGVDILTDPRFDVDSPAFDPLDPTVAKWHDLRGGYVTQLLRDLREALNEVDPRIRIAMTLSGEHVGPPLGNWRLDWRTWVDEGLVDEIVSPVFFEATLDFDAPTKGYLTDVRAGKGTVSHRALHEYIAQSKRPQVKVIAGGAYPYFAAPPPQGADGWRSDVWYDSYHLAWYQRWRQWRQDLADLGHIRFLEQSFDEAPLAGESALEAWGASAHVPGLRACPGVWYRLGDGRDPRPVVQEAVRRGDKGRAVKLTCSGDGRGALTGWHNSSPDRGRLTEALDTAITNGQCTLTYWLYRDGDSCDLATYLQSDGTELDVGLRMQADGRIAYSDHGAWVACDYGMPARAWQKFTLRVDLDDGMYSAFAGPGDEIALAQGVTYALPESRFVTQPGVNIPIPVPVYRSFRQVYFLPEGQPGAAMYVDDVSLRWVPTLHYARPGSQTHFADDFEAHTPGRRLHAARAGTGGVWQVTEGRPDQYTVHNGTSFGEGVNSLIARGGGRLLAVGERGLRLNECATLTADLDLFIRSSRPFPYMIPDPKAASTHRTAVGFISGPSAQTVAGARAADGVWECWDSERYRACNVPIAYDVWNHLQLALDTDTGRCRLVVQPVGEVPTFVGEGRLGRPAGSDVSFAIQPSDTAGHITCYDNIAITYDGGSD